MEILAQARHEAPIAAVLFDLDGTLADTLADIDAALNRSLQRLGQPLRARDDVRDFIGEGVARLAQQALASSAGEPMLPPSGQPLQDELVAAFIREYGEHCCERTSLFPGIAALLEALADRGMKLGVLTNKPDPLARRIVEQLCGPDRFAAVAGPRPGYPPKPDPAGALRLAGLLGAPPAACLFVGDSGIDMQTALAAGMDPIGVCWGYTSRDVLVAGGARVLLDEPAELLVVLG